MMCNKISCTILPWCFVYLEESSNPNESDQETDPAKRTKGTRYLFERTQSRCGNRQTCTISKAILNLVDSTIATVGPSPSQRGGGSRAITVVLYSMKRQGGDEKVQPVSHVIGHARAGFVFSSSATGETEELPMTGQVEAISATNAEV